MSEVRKQKRQDKFGDYLILGMIIPFVDSDATMGKLIRLNHGSHQVLKRDIYKYALLGC